jgi:hypothetical protein
MLKHYYEQVPEACCNRALAARAVLENVKNGLRQSRGASQRLDTGENTLPALADMVPLIVSHEIILGVPCLPSGTASANVGAGPINSQDE